MTGNVALWLLRFLCFSLLAAWGLWLGESGGANVGDTDRGSPYSAGASQRWALVVTGGMSMVHGDDSMWPGFIHQGQVASRRVPGGYSCIRYAASCVASDRPAAFCMAGSRLARSIAWALHSSPGIGRMLLQLRFSKTHGLVVMVSSTTSGVGGSTLGGRYFGSHAEPWRLALIPGWSHLGYLFRCCLWRDAPEICMRDIYLRDAARKIVTMAGPIPQGVALCSRAEGRRPGTRRGGLVPPQRVSVPF